MRYALQFAACTGCAVLICILFHVLPFIFPDGNYRAYVTYSFLEIIHSSANSLIFLVFNPEMQKKIFSHLQATTSSSLAQNQHVSPVTVIS